jgi:hypothetical protein
VRRLLRRLFDRLKFRRPDMQYRVASTRKGSGAVLRGGPTYNSYEDADRVASEWNEKRPDLHHWAEPAPEVEIRPDQIGLSVLRATVGDSLILRYPDGSYEHVIEAHNDDSNFPKEIDADKRLEGI